MAPRNLDEVECAALAALVDQVDLLDPLVLLVMAPTMAEKARWPNPSSLTARPPDATTHLASANPHKTTALPWDPKAKDPPAMAATPPCLARDPPLPRSTLTNAPHTRHPSQDLDTLRLDSSTNTSLQLKDQAIARLQWGHRPTSGHHPTFRKLIRLFNSRIILKWPLMPHPQTELSSFPKQKKKHAQGNMYLEHTFILFYFFPSLRRLFLRRCLCLESSSVLLFLLFFFFFFLATI